MRVDVIDADQRLAQRPRERLRRGHADQQRADQAGAVRDGDGVDLRRSRKRLCRAIRVTTGRMFSMCARLAISGTTPRYFACSSTCDATTLLTHVVAVVHDDGAPVSSQVDSMPRIVACVHVGRAAAARVVARRAGRVERRRRGGAARRAAGRRCRRRMPVRSLGSDVAVGATGGVARASFVAVALQHDQRDHRVHRPLELHVASAGRRRASSLVRRRLASSRLGSGR